MNKEKWRKRQSQWKRFARWQAEHPVLKLSPAERLAEIGVLVDRAFEVYSRRVESIKDVKENVAGIVLMRHQLAALSKTT